MTDPSAGISADAQVARIFEWRRGFNTIHLIDLGIRLGLFKAFADAPDSTAAQIAQKLGLNPPYVDVWCKTAFGMELLDAQEGPRYRLAPHLDTVLATPSHPRYLGGYVRLGTEVAAQDFRRCLTAFATGAVKPFQGRGDEFNQAIAESTWGLQVVTARKILPGLDGLSAQLDGGRVLEVGCGTGNLLVQLAKAFPQAQVVGVDIEADSLAAARAKIEKAGLTGRVEVREGGIGQTVEPESIDAVVMVEVLHEIGASIRPQVVRECGAVLKRGGWMVIVDETYPTTLEEMRRPEFKFPLMTGFEELLWGNVIPTREEQEQLLRDAGLTAEIQRSLIGEGFTVLATRKP
jgi:ubiquinone/menaquinone biosynthesis C-methylase UbiE